MPASYRHGDFPSIPSLRFVAHSAELPTEVKEVLTMFGVRGKIVGPPHTVGLASHIRNGNFGEV